MNEKKIIFGSITNKKYLLNNNLRNNQNYITNIDEKSKIKDFYNYKILRKDNSMFYGIIIVINFLIFFGLSKNINEFNLIIISFLLIVVVLSLIEIFLYKLGLKNYLNKIYFILNITYLPYSKIKKYNENKFYDNFIIIKKGGKQN